MKSILTREWEGIGGSGNVDGTYWRFFGKLHATRFEDRTFLSRPYSLPLLPA